MKYRIVVLAGCGFAGNGMPLTRDEVTTAVARIREYACHHFKGVTISPHFGSFNECGKTVTENGFSILILTDDPFQENPDVREEIRRHAVEQQGKALALFVRSALQQNSVILTVEPVAYFVAIDSVPG